VKSHELFSAGPVGCWLAEYEAEIMKNIDLLDRQTILDSQPDELVEKILCEHRLKIPTLRTSEVTHEREEVDIDIARDPTRVTFGRGRPVFVRGNRFHFWVPVDGDVHLLLYLPSSYDLNPPDGFLREGRIGFTHESTDQDARAMKAWFQERLSSVQRWVRYLAKDIESFNAALPGKVRARVEARITKIKRERELDEQLRDLLGPAER